MRFAAIEDGETEDLKKKLENTQAELAEYKKKDSDSSASGDMDIESSEDEGETLKLDELISLRDTIAKRDPKSSAVSDYDRRISAAREKKTTEGPIRYAVMSAETKLEKKRKRLKEAEEKEKETSEALVVIKADTTAARQEVADAENELDDRRQRVIKVDVRESAMKELADKLPEGHEISPNLAERLG